MFDMRKYLYNDYVIPNDTSTLSDQEMIEYEFIEQYLSLDEMESIALACERVEDVILSQFFFARAKQEGSTEKLNLLAEIVEDRLKIKGVKLGIPEFGYFS